VVALIKNMEKIIVITGASSGIGKALSLEYAQKGHHLILAALGEKELAETAKACEERVQQPQPLSLICWSRSQFKI
jgi:NADP-dependent 3-hydroxy acid dehydrogenase YdfG